MESRIRPFLACICVLVFAGCGGHEPRPRTPDESSDLFAPKLSASVIDEPKSSFFGEGTTRAGAELDGTTWTFDKAQCTEGPLDLSVRGFAQSLSVRTDGPGLLLTYDQTFQKEGCSVTVVQRATPMANSGEYNMVEETRVANPSTDACQGAMEEPRPGEIRHHGDDLEIVVQRSKNWCNGFDVLMTYVKAAPPEPTTERTLRAFVTAVNRRDPVAVSALYAENASLVDPYLRLDTGGASRVDGRAAIQRWYAKAFQGVPWAAMRIRAINLGAARDRVILVWDYIDPRLEAPLTGETRFVMAAGEIFESETHVTEKDGKAAQTAVPTDAPAPEATATNPADAPTEAVDPKKAAKTKKPAGLGKKAGPAAGRTKDLAARPRPRPTPAP